MKKKTSSNLPHRLPPDLQKNLSSFPKAKEQWKSLTALAKNEFICWIISAKKQETRNHRIERTITELMEGKRCPCCWPGCKHRK